MTGINRATDAADGTRRQSGPRRLLDWWCEGLAAAVAGLATTVRPPRRFQLRTTAAPFVLHAVNERGAPSAIELPDRAESGVPGEVLRRTRGSIIEIIVPQAAILERRLDPLPRESQPYVESVVQHRSETLLPWPAADTLRTVHIRDRDDGLLDVSVRATSRPAVAAALALAAACGAREVRITPHGGDAFGKAATGIIPVAIGNRNAGALAIARYAIGGLLTLAAVVVAWTAYTHWSLASELAMLDKAIAGRRAVLKRAADLQDRAGASGLEARRRQAVVAVAVIDALSTILPDDTYLTELSLDGGRLRISGVSARATEIVPLLEGSGMFKNASFYAPITRIVGRAADRFSIEAVAVPQTQVAP